MDLKNILFMLSGSDAVGNVREASDFAFNIMSKYVKTERTNNLGITGFLKGKSDYTIMLDAHIDQIAMVVTEVDTKGFLTVANAGGIDIRTLPARPVTVHGVKKIPAVFCSTPPHLASGEIEYNDISKLKIDTGLGIRAKDLISVGDYVTFSTKPCELMGNCVSGRSFDDRAGVVCVLELAERLSRAELPCNVAFVLSDGEELGMRGVRTSTYQVNPDEAIALDVSFGDGIGISEDECGRLADGGMIGICPCLDKGISNKLISIAKQNDIAYQTEVMAEHSGTNADMIAVTRGGVKTCTVSIPLRNMHTDCEILDVEDLYSICDLLEKYILSGGVFNA